VTSAVSYDLLVAEAESFPFASRAAYDQPLIALAQNPPGVLDNRTATLARALEERLRPHAAGLALETLAQIRDAAWFRPDPDGIFPTEVALVDQLLRLARHYLVTTGDRVTLRADDGLRERASRFRWLSLLLPQDLLVSALAASEAREPVSDDISLVTPQLAQVLERPVADTHLHGGAAFSFSSLWANLMGALRRDAPNAMQLERGGPPPFDSGNAFLGMLLAAAIARTLLAAFLWLRALDGKTRGFGDFLGEDLHAIARRAGWAFGADAARREYLSVLFALEGGRTIERSPPLLAALYRGLAGPATPGMRGAGMDPLSAFAPRQGYSTLPETAFAARALRYVATARDDDHFAQTFWQYERLRGLAYRHLTQEVGIGGLDWFTRHFQRISALRGSLSATLASSALELQSRDLHLAALEVRTSPWASWAGLLAEIRSLAAQTADFAPRPGHARPEIALVLHFLKERVAASTGRLHGDPEDPVFGCRYGRWAHQRDRERMAVTQLLEHRPETLAILRGIDFANVELAIPTWPTVPIVARLRRASVAAAAVLRRRKPSWGVPALRVTYHAGEDYRRLPEGLRRMHELIEFRVLGAGDRIGHGLALGESPARWASTARRVAQPREERLDDLLWELDRYGAGDLAPGAPRHAFVRHQASLLARAIYGGSNDAPVPDVDLLAEARRLRHDPRVLERLGFPFLCGGRPAHIGPLDAASALVLRYLTDARVFERGRQPIEIDVSEGEITMLDEAQRFLRGVVSALEITLESNPSSNLLIGNFRDVAEHPALRLSPLPGATARGGPSVLLSVNVDDPVTFASRLADEYAHLYFALLRGGAGSREALAWLDGVRENGFRSRFTLPVGGDARVLEELRSARG
jgi:hypothetical protein